MSILYPIQKQLIAVKKVRLYTGKAAKLKLFITIRESIHIALLRIKFMWHL